MNQRTTLKRNEILDTASQLFARYGYQRTNMKLLAQEAQASTSTIYSYFQDKNDLLSQSVERRLENLERWYLSRLQEIEDPVEALLQGVGLINEAIANDPLLSSLLVYDAQVADVRLSAHAKRVGQRVDDHHVALIRNAIEQGILTFDDPEALVGVFRLAFQGWLLNHAHRDEQIPLEALTRTVKRLLLELINDN